MEKTDLSFINENGKFNYKVCAIIIHDKKILAIRDCAPYYYLPGGRVQFGETAEIALIRELYEELGVQAKIIRPLWLNQAFFYEDVDKIRFHELCIYFLTDVSKSIICEKDSFVLMEGDKKRYFKWIEFDELKNEYFYPIFLKTAIYDLPTEFTIRSEIE